jgi:hypothetical protein
MLTLPLLCAGIDVPQVTFESKASWANDAGVFILQLWNFHFISVLVIKWPQVYFPFALL